MSDKKINLAKNKKQSSEFIKYFSFSAIIILILVFWLIEPGFLNKANLSSLLSDTAPLMIMACGATFVLLLGSVDLSVGAVCSVVNVLSVSLLTYFFLQNESVLGSALLGYGAALLFGGLAGLLLGLVHVYLKLPSFIASLGFMSIWKSVALLINNAPVSVPKLLRPAVDWAKISIGVVGLPLIFALCVVGIFFVLQTKTNFGKALYAIGGNERAARMAGIHINRTKITAFVLAGLCAALGSIFLVAKLKSSAPTVGDSFTLLVIASVALGGTALSGGKGSVLGTVLGVFMVSIIRNGMIFAGVDVFWQDIVFGIVVIAAVSVSVDRTTRNLIVK